MTDFGISARSGKNNVFHEANHYFCLISTIKEELGWAILEKKNDGK